MVTQASHKNPQRTDKIMTRLLEIDTAKEYPSKVKFMSFFNTDTTSNLTVTSITLVPRKD